MFFKHAQGVLTSRECDILAGRGRLGGFEAAKVNDHGQQRMMTSIRNNERFEFVDAVLADRLARAAKAALGADFPDAFAGRKFCCAGDHFRMYRYVPGQFFKPHKDGSFDAGNSESEITALFYLNDADGGETVLMPYGAGQAWAHVAIAPKKGDLLLFEHNAWHEGRPVASGEKLVLRTDLFYFKASEGE